MTTANYPHLADDVAEILRAIAEDADAFLFHGDRIASFSTLYEYVDANEYLDLIDGDRFRAIAEDADAYWGEYVPAVVEAVDAELRRRPVTA